ncbi:hypothetical protein F4774DRAFT_416897 [Daldinia eschscholtzii]|nr:hypothetical protein F4774DRAFT_416897 [Daldinia eschscholtzii]
MEALVAVGLASNVLQFVDFSAKLIHISSELQNNAASSEVGDYQVTTTHLRALAQNISDSAKAIPQSSTPATPEEKALQSVADECCKLADSLLGRLAKYSIQYSQNNSRLHRAKIAFKAIWNKKEIEEISNRLEFFRSQLTLYYAFQGRQTQLDQVARQSTTDDIQTILGRLENIKGLIESFKSDLGRTTNDQHLETLMSIKEARDENISFNAQAAQRATADHSLVYRELGSLQSSMNKVTTNLQHTQIQQSQILESVAHAKVENSSFFATVTQQLPLANDSSTLANALQPLLEQYKDELLIGVKKEFRSAARSAFNDMLQKTPATIDRMQHRSRAAQRVFEEVLKEGEDTTEKDLYTSEWYNAPSEEPKLLSLERRHFGQSDKNSVTIRYQNRLWWNTRLGCLMITIQDRDYFNETRSLTTRYELIVQFTPSPSWMSTGFLMTYENKTDARGSPEFGLRFKTYRIIPLDHDIFNALAQRDVRTVQNMLSQKLVLPSDRDDRGWSLLIYATLLGKLDICKALVQGGTDINARGIP